MPSIRLNFKPYIWIPRDLPDESRAINADFALKYVQKKFCALKRFTKDDEVACAEAYVQCQLNRLPIPKAFPTCKILDAMSRRFDMAAKIVCNSVGIEERWKKIEDIQFEVSKLNRWICDIDCAILSGNLKEEYTNKHLLHQRPQ
jgi:hypothetical protein